MVRQVIRYYVVALLAMLAMLAERWPALALGRAGQTTTVSDLSSDMISAYIAAKTLMIAEREFRLYQFAEKAKLPTRNSRTFQFSRYTELNVPTSTLTEGVTPSATTMGVETVTAQVQQWGMIVAITDLAELVIAHPLTQTAIDRIGRAMAYVVEREIGNTLLAGTTVRRADGVAARSSLSSANALDTADIATAVSTLRQNGAPTFEDGLYVGVIRPDMEMDIAAGDSTFRDAASRSNIKSQFRGEIGVWYGVRWVRSNILPVYDLESSPTTAGVAAGGSLAASTTYYFSLVRKSLTTGQSTQISAEFSRATGAGDDAVRITLPSASGFTFDVYAGSVSGTRYLALSNQTQNTNVDVLSIPTSGDTAPVQPASGVSVAIGWIFGRQAYTVVELESQEPSGASRETVKAYVTPNTPSDSDTLVQRRKIGAKVTFRPAILNQTFVIRLEAYTAY